MRTVDENIGGGPFIDGPYFVFKGTVQDFREWMKKLTKEQLKQSAISYSLRKK